MSSLLTFSKYSHGKKSESEIKTNAKNISIRITIKKIDIAILLRFEKSLIPF